MVKQIKIMALVATALVFSGCMNNDNIHISEGAISKKCSFVNWISRAGNVYFILASPNPRAYAGDAYFVNNKLVRLHEFSESNWRTEKDIFFDSEGIVSKVETGNDVCYYQYNQDKVSKIQCKNKYTIVDYSHMKTYVPTCKIYSNDGNFIKKKYCFAEPDIMPIPMDDETGMNSRIDRPSPWL